MLSLLITVFSLYILADKFFPFNADFFLKQKETRPEVLSHQDSKEEATVEIKSKVDVDSSQTPPPPPGGPLPPPANKPIPPDNDLFDLRYSDSVLISSTDTTLILESTASTEAITTWYKEKIIAMGMNAKSFVTTKANEKVLNKLVGADGKREVRVEISQENSSSVVKIKVSLTNK